MSEKAARTEHVRYRLPSGHERAIYSRYVEGAGVVFDLPVPYRIDRPVRTVAHEIIDPHALDGIVIDHMCRQVEQQDAEVLWTRLGLLLDDAPLDSPRSPRTVVVNKGRGERFDVYIGRGSIWGNRYSHRPSSYPGVIRVATPERAVALYRRWLWVQIRSGAIMPEDLAALHGKRLGCFCKPRPCHGDVLVSAAAWAYAQLTTGRT